MKGKNNNRLIALAVVAVSLTGWAIYAKFFQAKTAKLTPTQQSIQDEVSKDAEKANENFTGTTGGGGVTDTSGTTTAPATQTNNPVSSTSGVITLSSHSDGSKLANGGTVAGTAKVATVQYRIRDNSRGQLAMGQLSVVDGKYSGTISIKPAGSTGTLEVFNFNANGVEENHVKINVTF